MSIISYMKPLHSMLFCLFMLCGCYSPIINLQSIGLAKDSQYAEDIQTTKQRTTNSLIFYKECSRNGSAWLYECQSIGLESIQQAIYLYYPNATINDIVMLFYPKKTYIRFEIYDSNVFQDVP